MHSPAVQLSARTLCVAATPSPTRIMIASKMIMKRFICPPFNPDQVPRGRFATKTSLDPSAWRPGRLLDRIQFRPLLGQQRLGQRGIARRYDLLAAGEHEIQQVEQRGLA